MDLMSTAQLMGNFGEFVGAIAVVLTLAYLAVQIKESRAETARASRQSAQQAVGDFNLRIASDESFYLLFCRGIFEPGKLTDEEVFRFDLAAYSMFDMFETLHATWKRGGLTDHDWRKWDTIIANYLTLEGIQVFWSRLSHQFTSDFQDYIDSLPKEKNYAFGR
jgi:hypothetical protein